MPAETMISILGATLVAAAWALWLLKDRESEAQVSRVYGIPLCQACGRHHQRGEDHRL